MTNKLILISNNMDTCLLGGLFSEVQRIQAIHLGRSVSIFRSTRCDPRSHWSGRGVLLGAWFGLQHTTLRQP